MIADIDPVLVALDDQGANSLVVAYSGGIDSTLLLHIASLYGKTVPNIRIRALHVDHGNAFATGKSYSEHCRNWCQQNDINLCIKKITIKPVAGKSLEQLARSARYDIFADHLEAGELLLMAHHLDDQLETLLLRLNRGSGLRGLAAIPRRRNLGEGALFRPLLSIERAQIVNLARHYSLQWIEDPANSNIDFDRNYLRHKIIYRLRQRWPDLAKRWHGSLTLLEQQNQIMDWMCQRQLQPMLSETGAISVAAMSDYPQVVQGQLIIAWIRQSGLHVPSRNIINTIIEQMYGSAKIDLPQQNIRKACVRIYRQHMYLLTTDPPSLEENYKWNPNTHLQLPHGQLRTRIVPSGGISCSGDTWQVGFRLFRKKKDVIRLPGRKHSTSLKNLFQQLGVPPWQRPYLPLIFDRDKLVAVADMAVDQSVVTSGNGLIIEWKT